MITDPADHERARDLQADHQIRNSPMPYELSCYDCDAGCTEPDPHTALVLVEGHQDRHDHAVRVREVRSDE